MRTRRAGQGEVEAWLTAGPPPIWTSTPDEPAGRPPRPEERTPHLRGRLGTIGDLLALRAAEGEHP